MAFKAAPLPHEWMLTSIIGFFVSLLYLYGSLGLGEGYRWAVQWGAAFMAFFVILFIASMVSMTNAGTEPEHLEELAIHEIRKRQTKRTIHR